MCLTEASLNNSGFKALAVYFCERGWCCGFSKLASAQSGAAGKDLLDLRRREKGKAVTLSENHRDALFMPRTYRQAKLTST